MNSFPNFYFGQDPLTIDKAYKLAQGQLLGQFSQKTQQKINTCAAAVKTIACGHKRVYAINTGFGALCDTQISAADTQILQKNLLLSHAVGVGEPIDNHLARLMLVLKLQALSMGYSGIQQSTLNRILWHLNQNLIPRVPAQGSVGASGDLAPLAHLFLPLIGEGFVWHQNNYVPTARLLKKFGLKPLELGPKEGLALINGTQFIAAHAIEVARRFHNALEHADILAAMSVEALLGSKAPFDSKLHHLRPFVGAKHVAHRLRYFLNGSGFGESHKNCPKVQDPYSIRCVPQVHGASRDAWLHLKSQLTIELNSVTDNPLVFSPTHTLSGGNFHGQPLALPLDYVALAASELGNISDRRSYLLLSGYTPALKLCLTKQSGLHSGLMIVQYTSAALASENKTLTFPASADSIPTSLGQEDHVSMGSISGRKALMIVNNLESILAVELLCASQAVTFHRPLLMNKALERCYQMIREHIAPIEEDRIFAYDIEKAKKLIQSQTLLLENEPGLNPKKNPFTLN